MSNSVAFYILNPYSSHIIDLKRILECKLSLVWSKLYTCCLCCMKVVILQNLYT